MNEYFVSYRIYNNFKDQINITRSPGEYAENPINAFHLLHRAVFEWSEVVNYIKSVVYTNAKTGRNIIYS